MSGPLSATMLAKLPTVLRISLWVRSGACMTWKPAELKNVAMALASLAGFGSAETEV